MDRCRFCRRGIEQDPDANDIVWQTTDDEFPWNLRCSDSPHPNGLHEPVMVTLSFTLGDTEYLANVLYHAPGGHGHLTDEFRTYLHQALESM